MLREYLQASETHDLLPQLLQLWRCEAHRLLLDLLSLHICVSSIHMIGLQIFHSANLRRVKGEEYP